MRLLAFILTPEAAFDVGILRGRYQWKDDAGLVQPVLVIMSLTLAVLLWALYRQARQVANGSIIAAKDA